MKQILRFLMMADTGIIDEEISLVEKNYSIFEYAIVCEVCHITGEDY